MPSGQRFEDFYRRHYVALVKAAVALGATVDEAHEIVDRVMEEAWRDWPTLSRPLAWSRRAVYHHLLKVRQRERRQHRVIVEDEILARQALQEPGTNLWEDRQWVLQLLRRLPPAQREVMAHIVDGLAPIETARLLGKSAPTVRKNLQLARERLKREIEAQERLEGGEPMLTEGGEEESGAAR
jgi:RNA polymerase sigma factor (sigma-70 family)